MSRSRRVKGCSERRARGRGRGKNLEKKGRLSGIDPKCTHPRPDPCASGRSGLEGRPEWGRLSCSAMVDRAVQCSMPSAGQPPRRAALPRRVPGGTARVQRSLACLVRVLLCQVLPACFVLAFAHVAGAATSLPRVSGSLDGADAPICDPTGASAPAPADIPEVDGGRLEELPCESLGVVFEATFGGRRSSTVTAASAQERGSPERGPQGHDGASPERARHEGAPVVAAQFPERSEPALLAFASPRGLARWRGHRSLVYRPPLHVAG